MGHVPHAVSADISGGCDKVTNGGLTVTLLHIMFSSPTSSTLSDCHKLTPSDCPAQGRHQSSSRGNLNNVRALNAQHTTQGPGCTETKMANTIKVNDLPISKVVFPPLSFVINLMNTFI